MTNPIQRIAARRYPLMIVAASVVLAACTSSSSAVRVDQAESGPPRCTAFAWHSQSQEAASLTEQRVRSAALETLGKKGYTTTSPADCRVSYVLSTHETGRGRPSVGVGAGGGSGGIGGGIGVSIPVGKRAKYSGTFTVDVIDNQRNAQVWSGSLDVGLREQEPTEEEVREAVAQILSRYPDRR